MKKLLVPTDFSPEAKNAHRFARQVAKKIQGQITFLHVLEVPYGSFNVMGEVMTTYTYENLYESELIQRTEERLQELVDDSEGEGIPANFKLVFGNPYSTINETIEEQKTDLVVLGSKGASGLKEVFIGSNAERVIRNARCPVITVKGESDFEKIKGVAFATDTSNEQDLLVPQIKEFQKLFSWNIHLVRVCTHHNMLTQAKALESLEEFAKRNDLENYTVGTLQAEFTDEGVIQFALNHKFNMIIMGTHGRTGIAHFFGGSIAEDVANHSHIPILTLNIKEYASK